MQVRQILVQKYIKTLLEFLNIPGYIYWVQKYRNTQMGCTGSKPSQKGSNEKKAGVSKVSNPQNI
jgi:hypothetical protein